MSTVLNYTGLNVYYTNQHAYPNANIYKVLNINYYDTYPSDIPAIPTQVLGQNVLPQDAQNSSISTKSTAQSLTTLSNKFGLQTLLILETERIRVT